LVSENMQPESRGKALFVFGDKRSHSVTALTCYGASLIAVCKKFGNVKVPLSALARFSIPGLRSPSNAGYCK
jgi:hypothetical protein